MTKLIFAFRNFAKGLETVFFSSNFKFIDKDAYCNTKENQLFRVILMLTKWFSLRPVFF
jgi:hypothetical protein